MTPGPSGPLCLLLRSTFVLPGEAPDAPVRLSSSSPTGLLAVPRTPPDLSPSRFWFPAFDSIWNVLSPSVEILPLQGPCPNASSTRKPPPSGSAFWKRLYPLPRLSLPGCAQGCLPGQAVDAGRAGTITLLCASSSPACLWGWGGGVLCGGAPRFS